MKLRSLFILTLLLSCSSGGGGSGDDSSGSNNLNTGNGGSGGGGSFARCATADPDSKTFDNLKKLFNGFHLARSTSAFQREATIDIPVYFHVISKGPELTDGEVPDEMILEQMEILNRGFSGEIGGTPTPYRFLLQGINRIRDPEQHLLNPGSDAEFDLKEKYNRGGLKALNVFVGSIDGNVLGYTLLPIFASILPAYDGVVLHYGSLPGSTFKRYNVGHTLIHEAGHWLGLMHTFQGGCDGAITDLVSDTPAETQPMSGEYCPVGRNTCPDQSGDDPIHNHMTYTEDTCRTEFTPGQVDFMSFNAALFRQMF